MKGIHSQNDHQLEGRLMSVSIFRVISMLMIILIHCMCFSAGYWDEYFHCPEPSRALHDLAAIMAALALPIFFFVSGFLNAYNYVEKGKYRAWPLFVANKFKRLILPTVIWTVIYLMILPFRYPLTEVLTGIQHLWFLPVLFSVFILVRLITPWLVRERTAQADAAIACAIVIACYLLYLVYRRCEIHDSLFIGRVLTYLGYFVVGMMAYKHRLALRNKVLEAVLVLFLLACHAACLTVFVSLAHGLVNIFVTIGICVFALDLLSAIKFGNHSRIYSVFNGLDRNGMDIYLIHQVLIMLLYQYTGVKESLMLPHPYLGIAILMLTVLPVSWALSEMKRRLQSRL